jgi:hypothetical protein
VGIIDHPKSIIESSPARAKSEEASQTAQHEIPGRSDQELASSVEAVVEAPPPEPRRTHAVSAQACEIPPAAQTTAWKDQRRQWPKRKTRPVSAPRASRPATVQVF